MASYDRRIPLLRHFIYKKLSVEKSQKDFWQKATAIKDFDSVNYKSFIVSLLSLIMKSLKQQGIIDDILKP